MMARINKQKLINGKQRARTAKEKDLRRESLLMAGLTLLVENRGQLPTVSAIASKAGVAKGTAYIYFQTKESIYMALLEQNLYGWLDEFRHQLRFVKTDIVQGIIDSLLSYEKKQPHLWKLASLGHFQLEPSIDKKDLLSHKTRLAQEYRASAKAIVAKSGLPEQAVDTAQATLLKSYTYLLGCWQVACSPVSIQDLLKGPGLHLLQPEFKQLAQQGLSALWIDFFSAYRKEEERSGLLKRLFQR